MLIQAKQKSIKESNFEEIEKEVQFYYQNSPQSNKNFEEISKILTSFDVKRASMSHSTKIKSLNFLQRQQMDDSGRKKQAKNEMLGQGHENKQFGDEDYKRESGVAGVNRIGRTSIKNQIGVSGIAGAGERGGVSYGRDSFYESGMVLGSIGMAGSPISRRKFL